MAERDGPIVLVVDDIEDNRYTLIRRLNRQGIDEVLEAADGRAALEILKSRPVDLVLLDIMMPEMSGFDVLKTVKSDTALRDTPVIMISAVDELESVVQCIKLGAEDYLPKPFNPTLLRARVEASLEKKRLRDREAAYRRELEAARRRADDLLHAVLPVGAIRELKATDTVTPRRYEDVAVLFCDIVGFTPYCEANQPEEVVDALQSLVDSFESIAASHGLEKIKTIGDAFLATANMLQPVSDPVPAALRCAMEMVARAPETGLGWRVRAGIHSGSVVAGIVGHQRLLFDLWGDTVNTAARIVDHAEPDTVLISGTSWLQAGEAFRGRSVGEVELKGKGPMELIECVGEQ